MENESAQRRMHRPHCSPSSDRIDWTSLCDHERTMSLVWRTHVMTHLAIEINESLFCLFFRTHMPMVHFSHLTTQKDDPSITLFRILHRGTCNNDILDDSRREGRVPFLMVVQITDTVKPLYSGHLWDHWKVSTIQRCLYKEVLLYI